VIDQGTGGWIRQPAGRSANFPDERARPGWQQFRNQDFFANPTI